MQFVECKRTLFRVLYSEFYLPIAYMPIEVKRRPVSGLIFHSWATLKKLSFV